MLKLIKYIILFIFLDGSLAAAKNQPSGIWVGKINCNHERSEFSLEIIENDINLQIGQQSYKGSASFERKNHLVKIKAKNSLDGNELIENLYFSVNGKTLTGKVKVNCNVSAYNSSFDYDKLMPINSNSVSVETYDKLSKATVFSNNLDITKNDVALIQKALLKKCFNSGPIDGQLGPKTLQAIKNIFKLNNSNLQNEINKRLYIKIQNFKLNNCTLNLSQKVIHYDNFSGELDTKYLPNQIPKCLGQCKKYNALTYLEDGANKYVSLSSKQGQMSLRNKGDNVWNKDRIKLAIELPFSDNQINKKTIWYGFKAKFPQKIKSIHAQNITFTELHQIEKSRGNKFFCTKAMFWRYNFENRNRTWAAVTNGAGKILKKQSFGYPTITDEWTTFKIGIYFDDNHGWLRVIRNGYEVFDYEGNTYSMLWSKNPKCSHREPLRYFLEIGVYRGIKFKYTPEDYASKIDTIHFDDFIISELESDVDKALGY